MWNLKRCFKQYPSRVGVGINFTANRKRSSHETVHFISALRSSSIKLPRNFPTRPAPNCPFSSFSQYYLPPLLNPPPIPALSNFLPLIFLQALPTLLLPMFPPPQSLTPLLLPILPFSSSSSYQQ